jgi:hypothetical protein
MATTYTLISSNVLSSTAASVTFSSIPGTYTDLVLRISARSDRAAARETVQVQFNSTGSGLYSETRIQGSGSAVSSFRNTAGDGVNAFFIDSAVDTASTFASLEAYIPSYAAAIKKQFSAIGALENNATEAYIRALAGLFDSTSAISSITLTPTGPSNFVSGSSFYLYGIKNS